MSIKLSNRDEGREKASLCRRKKYCRNSLNSSRMILLYGCSVKRLREAENTTVINLFLCRSVTQPSVTSAQNLCSTSRRCSVKVRG